MTDADAHVVEATFFLDAAARWPEQVRLEFDTQPGLYVEGRRYPTIEGPGAGCPPAQSLNPAAAPNAPTAEGMLVDADREGIDRLVLFPSGGLCAFTLQDPGFGAEFCDAYNEWVAGFCAAAPERLFGVAVAPVEHPGIAAGVLERAADLGLVAAVAPPGLADRNLDHPDLDPLYETVTSLDLPLTVHGAPGMHMPKIGVDRFSNYIQVHMVSFPFDLMTALTAVLSGGVLDRHPGLRVAFLEAGCSWFPYFLERMHEHWEKRGDWIAGGWARDPWDYVAEGRLTVSCEPDERLLPHVLDIVGDGAVMWASDYPHWDGEFPHAAGPIRERDDLDDEQRRRVCDENAAAFYRLP